jgi:hypothetical protein
MDHFLNDCWAVYFHDPSDENWSRSSFHKIVDFTTVEDFWSVNAAIAPHIHQGMFFIMRESVFPLWEEKENRDGGYMSLKILKANVAETWDELCVKMLSEALLKPAHENLWDHINGISISPKKTFCIIKIWLRSQQVNAATMYNIRGVDPTEILFKAY